MNLRISDDVYNSVINSTNTSSITVASENTKSSQSEASGLNAIVSAAQRLESKSVNDGPESLVLPPVSSDLPSESFPI